MYGTLDLMDKVENMSTGSLCKWTLGLMDHVKNGMEKFKKRLTWTFEIEKMENNCGKELKDNFMCM